MSVPDIALNADHTIRDALRQINTGTKGIALVVDEAGILSDTITDGDVRRGILSGLSTEDTIGRLLETKQSHSPLTCLEGTSSDEMLRMMREAKVRQLPVVDAQGRPVDLVLLEDLISSQPPVDLQAVIMAGGFGKRLMPLTEDTPKPMLPVGDKPLIEHIVSSLAGAGIRNVSITTHYKAEQIVNHFQDGSRFGVNVSYVNEDQPLGTAGALSLMDSPTEPMLVMNGDILTNVNYRALLDFHRSHHADMTICVRQFDLQVPYGVVESEEALVTKITEKPKVTFFVNAGIYLLEPHLHARIPRDSKYDMPDLVSAIIREGGTVASFPIVEYWLDIGQHADYNRAQEVVRRGELGF